MEVRILEKEIKGIVKDIDDLGTWMKEIREFMNTRLVRQAY